MAREPIKVGSVVSAQGQVGNRAAYMRPANDRSGSKALSDALGSLSGSLQQFNSQVDRYQNARRQAELEEAQRFQNAEVARYALEGATDGAAGQPTRGPALQDSPIFQAAYQEGHMDASIRRRLTQLERDTNWEEFNSDVDAGHDKLQAFLLQESEGMLAGYSPEVQAKMYPTISNWANGKMAAQTAAAKERRISNMQEDLTATIESQMALGEGPDAIRAAMEEQMNIFGQAGVADPSGKAAQALLDAAVLTRDPDAINQVLADEEFSTQMLNTDARKKLIAARDQLEAQERAIENRERSEYNRAFLQSTAGVQMEAMQALAGGNSRQAVDMLDGMLAQAYEHPDSQAGLAAVKALDAMKKAILEPPVEKLDPVTEYSLRLSMQEELAMAAASGMGPEGLTEIAAGYIGQGVSPSQALTSTNAAFAFAEEQDNSYDRAFTSTLSVITGELASASDMMPDTSEFLGMNEVDVNKNSVANFVKMERIRILQEQEQMMVAKHGPEWRSSVSRDEVAAIDADATARAFKAAGMHPGFNFKALLDNGTSRARLFSSPVMRQALEQMIGPVELARYDAMDRQATAQSEAALAQAAADYN